MSRTLYKIPGSGSMNNNSEVFGATGFAGLKLRKIPKDQIKERVGRAAKTLGIEMLLDRKPKQLSGGQRQRVAVGRAIVREPSVFLFDEPLSNLDAKLRVQTRAEISKLHQQLQTTFIYVTHDQVEAMTMATRIAVMKDGVLQQCDTPQAVYSTPANIFVAGFIGSPSMNFFEGTVEESDGKLMLNSKAFRIPIPLEYRSPWENLPSRLHSESRLPSHVGRSRPTKDREFVRETRLPKQFPNSVHCRARQRSWPVCCAARYSGWRSSWIATIHR